MADELAKQIAAAKQKMFGTLPPPGIKMTVLVRGGVKVETKDPGVVIKKMD